MNTLGVYDNLTETKLKLSPAAGFTNQCFLCVQDCLKCPNNLCDTCAYSR
jgi:hypothetical protein